MDFKTQPTAFGQPLLKVGDTITQQQKAGAFASGELAAGEVGIDTTTGDLYLSYDGTTVTRYKSEVEVTHGADATVVRPTASRVIWRGSVAPNNALDNDRWLNQP